MLAPSKSQMYVPSRTLRQATMRFEVFLFMPHDGSIYEIYDGFTKHFEFLTENNGDGSHVTNTSVIKFKMPLTVKTTWQLLTESDASRAYIEHETMLRKIDAIKRSIKNGLEHFLQEKMKSYHQDSFVPRRLKFPLENDIRRNSKYGFTYGNRKIGYIVLK